MEKVIINHSCEIYSKRTLSPIYEKKITYKDNFREKISLKRIFNKNYKEMFPEDKLKKTITRQNQDENIYNNNTLKKKFEYDFSKYIKTVL
jgi:hypothetical protein